MIAEGEYSIVTQWSFSGHSVVIRLYSNIIVRGRIRESVPGFALRVISRSLPLRRASGFPFTVYSLLRRDKCSLLTL